MKTKCVLRRFVNTDLVLKTRARYPIDETGSAVTRRADSGKSKSVLLQLVNILKLSTVGEKLCIV